MRRFCFVGHGKVSFVAVPSPFATGERKDTNIYVASVVGSLS